MFAGSVTALSSCERFYLCVCVCVSRAAINNTPHPTQGPSVRRKGNVENGEATMKEQHYQTTCNSIEQLVSPSITAHVLKRQQLIVVYCAAFGDHFLSFLSAEMCVLCLFILAHS